MVVLQVGDECQLSNVTPGQHFTQPLPHYSESSLIKALEKLDIGRPSTYDSIVETLKVTNLLSLIEAAFMCEDCLQSLTSTIWEDPTTAFEYFSQLCQAFCMAQSHLTYIGHLDDSAMWADIILNWRRLLLSENRVRHYQSCALTRRTSFQNWLLIVDKLSKYIWKAHFARTAQDTETLLYIGFVHIETREASKLAMPELKFAILCPGQRLHSRAGKVIACQEQRKDLISLSGIILWQIPGVWFYFQHRGWPGSYLRY